MPKATTPATASRRHNPLEDDLTASGGILKNKPAKRKSRHQEEGDQFVDSKASRKILRLGQELADEDEATDRTQDAKPIFNFETRSEGEEEDTYEDEEAWAGIDEEVGEVDVDELSPEDLATFNKFFPQKEDPLLRRGWGGEDDGGVEETDEGAGTNLADLILEKIAAHEAGQTGGGRDVPGPIDEEFEIPPKVVEVYTKYGKLTHSLRPVANLLTELAFSSRDTSPESYRNPSRSFLQFLAGKISLKLLDQTSGPQTPVTKLPKSSYRVHLPLPDGLWKWFC